MIIKTRFEFGIEISMISNGNFFRDRLVNISEGGAMLELSNPQAISRDVMIKAELGPDHRVVALGDVKWMGPKNGPRKVGIQFLYLPPEMKAKVNGLSDKRL